MPKHLQNLRDSGGLGGPRNHGSMSTEARGARSGIRAVVTGVAGRNRHALRGLELNLHGLHARTGAHGLD